MMFPLDFDRHLNYISLEDNHKSAKDYEERVKHHLHEEVEYGAILCPFKSKHIDFDIGPFVTTDRLDSQWRCTIVDLSWPYGTSVNAGVQKDTYLNSNFVLTYPSVDQIVNRIIQLGSGSLIYKLDISCDFRQIKVDPGENIVGHKIGGIIISINRSHFGFRHGSFLLRKSEQ